MRTPARNSPGQGREVARDDGVAERHRRLGGERAQRLSAAQDAVAAQQVAAREAGVASLPCGAVPVCGGAEVHADGVWCHGRLPAGGAQAKRQVEVLRVGEDRLVQPADLHSTPCAGMPPRRPPAPPTGCAVRGSRDRQAREPWKARERAVGAQADAVDGPLAWLHQQARHRAHLGLGFQRREQALQPIGVTVDVVVQQHQDLAVAGVCAAVTGGGKAQAVLGSDELDRGPVAGDSLHGLLVAAVIGDDHRVRAGLPCQMRQAVLRQVIVPRRWDHDVDGERQGGPSYPPARGWPVGRQCLSTMYRFAGRRSTAHPVEQDGVMHVGLNLIFLVPGETGGMEVAARELIPALVAAAPEGVRFTAFVNREAAGAKDGPWGELLPSVTVPVNARNRLQWVRGEQLLLPRLAARQGVDLVHSLASTAPARGRFRRVVTVHDLIYARFPEAHAGIRDLGMRLLVPLAIRRSDRVIVDSQSTRRDLVELLGTPRERIEWSRWGSVLCVAGAARASGWCVSASRSPVAGSR